MARAWPRAIRRSPGKLRSPCSAVVLADEPNGNLDEDTRDEIIALLETMWHERGLTMVFVIPAGDWPARLPGQQPPRR